MAEPALAPAATSAPPPEAPAEPQHQDTHPQDQPAAAAPSTPDAAPAPTPAPAPAPAPTPAPHAPPVVKKFTPMNATRKFLEKTSASTANTIPASGAAAQAAAASKTPAARPAATPSPSASKLVAAKLSTLNSSSAPAGWARPPAPPAAATPGDSPTPAAAQPLQQLQRPASGSKTRSSSPGKPVWGAPPAPARAPAAAPPASDFPTAAEAATRAQRERVPPRAGPPAANANANANAEPSAEQIRSDAQKQAMAETAAVFRGAHLDPNASHWDEMDDDEGFLEGVVEFGDGTQYKVEAPVEHSPPRPGPDQAARAGSHAKANGAPPGQQDDERGWTRVTAKGGAAPSSTSSATTASLATPSPLVSPHEPPSRALYNDRSGRFEPYNGKPSGARGPFRRDSRDSAHEPPPHLAQRSPIQLLQKHGPGEHRTPPQESARPGVGSARDSGPVRTLPSVFDRPHERGRPGAPDGGPPSRPGSGFHAPPHRGSMGPPPPPSQHGREAPPHLGRGPPSTISNGRESPMSATSSRFSRRDSVSSAVPPAPLSIGKMASPEVSAPPVVAAPAIPVPTPEEQEELMKQYRLELAEKARKRRQEEEEERNREKDRARKKAAELEERMEAEKRAKEEAAAAKAEAERKERERQEAERKEAAAKAEAERQAEAERKAAAAAAARAAAPPFERPRVDTGASSSRPSAFGRPRAPSERAFGFQPAPPIRAPSIKEPPAPDPVMQLDSWRSKAAPPASPRATTPVPKPTQSFVTSLFTTDFSLKPDEEVEVIDFADISKLAPEPSPSTAVPPPAPKPPPQIQLLQRPPGTFSKPSAPPPPGPPLKSDTNVWRKPTAETSQAPAGSPPAAAPATGGAAPWARRPADAEAQSKPSLSPVTSTSPTISPPRKHGRTTSGSEPLSPRQVPYREAPMSALTDTMSRIKGALDGMQTEKEASPPSVRPTEAPPTQAKFKPNTTGSVWREREANATAKRIASQGVSGDTNERLMQLSLVFLPEPGSPTNRVRLPAADAEPREPVSKKQLHMWQTITHVRFDILSLDPPPKGMSRRTLMVEESLFDRLHNRKGAPLYTVALPKKRLVNSRALAKIEAPPVASTSSAPPPRPPPVPAPVRQGSNPAPQPRGSLFGTRSKGVDEPSWRKPAPPKPEQEPQSELNPVSRSPPPDMDRPTVAQPASSSVANPDVPKTPPTTLTTPWGQSPLGLSTINSPSSKPPDRDHLKQVWSQKLDKDGKPSGNSLRDIADEPTRLSFSMQEMKSDEGDTPPPTMSSTNSGTASVTRMSVQDAHRAFQTVPSSSSATSSPRPPPRQPLQNQQQPTAPTSQPPPTHPSASPHRPPQPMPMRIFGPYPPQGSPHLAPAAHGPHLYALPPQPQPGQQQRPPVNGAPPQMAQGWVVAPAGQQPQQQQFMRPPPPGSPYMVAYGPPPGVYLTAPPQGQPPHQMPKPGQPLQPGPSGAGRGRGMPMMSPGPSQAQPHISPVPAPGQILQHMAMPPYQGGPIPSIYHMPPAPGQGMVHPHPGAPPGQPMPGMYPGGPPRPPIMQYPPAGGFVPAPPPQPHAPFLPRPNW